MSYDYVLMKLKSPVADPSELGPDTVANIGDASTVRRAIAKVVTGIEWLDWGGSVQSEDGFLEFCVSADEAEVTALMVRASHRSDHGWESSVLSEVCRVHDWVAFDPQTNEFIFPAPKPAPR